MNGVLSTLMLATVALLAVAFTPPRVLSHAITVVQHETPPALSNAIVRTGSNLIPDGLLARVDGGIAAADGGNPYRQTLGGDMERSANAVASKSAALLRYCLRLIEALVLLVPLRLAAMIPYLLLYTLLMITALWRSARRKTIADFNIEVDTTGDIADPVKPVNWGTLLLLLTVALLLFPLPIPIWVMGGLLCLHPVLMDRARAPRRIPAVSA